MFKRRYGYVLVLKNKAIEKIDDEIRRLEFLWFCEDVIKQYAKNLRIVDINIYYFEATDDELTDIMNAFKELNPEYTMVG